MKKAVSLILALVMCLSLCACNQAPAGNTNPNLQIPGTVDSVTPTGPAPTGPAPTEQAPTISTEHTHDWLEATCTAPRTCKICGETTGETAQHQWNRTTCTAPYTCTLCNASSGEEGTHVISEGVCVVCGNDLETIEKEPASVYQKAITALEYKHYGSHYGNERIREAYDILVGLGDYKDAAQYVKRFTILPDRLLGWECEVVNAFGEIERTAKGYYGYDVKGQMIFYPAYECCLYSDIRYNGDIIHYECEYDELGRVIQRTYLYGNNPQYRTTYAYDEEGKLAESRVRYVHSDTTASLTKYFYDDAGKENRRETLMENGSQEVITFSYDQTGNLIREEKTQGSESGVVTYAYDDFGNCIRAQGDDYTEHGYQYDSEGNLIKHTYDQPSGLEEYDYAYENGRIVSVRCTHTFGTSESYLSNYVYGDYYIYTPEK